MDATKLDERLIGQNPRDEVLIAAQKFREKQDLDKEAERRALLEKKKQDKIERNEDLRKTQKKVYEAVFFFLAGKYLKLEKDYCGPYLNSLSRPQIKELENYIYGRAKRFLLLRKVLVAIPGIAVPLLGWGWLIVMFGKDMDTFPSYKFVALRDWYRKEFGQISFGSRQAMVGEVVIPNLRD